MSDFIVKSVRYIRGGITPFLMRVMIAVAPGISRPRLLAFGRWMGAFMYYISRAHRRRALYNLNIAFGSNKTGPEMEQIAKAAFQDFAKTGVEMLMYNACAKNALREQMIIEGREHLDRALESGKGVIGLTAHFGNFIALHGRLALEGYKINCVVKALRDKGVEDILQAIRTDQGMNTIYVNHRARCVRACRAALAANEILILTNDQPQKNGVQVDFFGSPVWTVAGPATFALSTGAAVVPVFAVRNPDDTHSLIISESVSLIRTGDDKRDVVVNTQAFTRITESYVSRYPEQWAWNQRRWRYQGGRKMSAGNPV